MPLKTVVENLEEVPEALQEHYEERDGKYVLSLEDAFTREDRDKLQDSLRKEREEHKKTKGQLKKFGEYTPETIEQIQQEKEELETRLQAAETDDAEERQKKIEELAERRAAAKTKPIERKLREFQEELERVDGERKQLQQRERTQRIVDAVANPTVLKELGVVPDAVEDLKLWALHNFEVDENGNVLSKDNTDAPGLSPKEVLTDLRSSGKRRHWFGTTQGAGATGGSASESFQNNPFARDTLNLTQIGQLVKSDPEKAKRMAKAASKNGHDATRYLPQSLKPSA